MTITRNTGSSVMAETESDVAIASIAALQVEVDAGLLRSSTSYLVIDGSQVVDTATDSATLTVEGNAGKLQSTLSAIQIDAKAEKRPTLVNVLEFVLCDDDGLPVAYLNEAFNREYLATVGDVGGGSFSIHTSSFLYAGIAIGNIVRVRFAGSDIGAFRIETIAASLADETLAIAKMKGRGLLADLESALVYPDGSTKERSWTSSTCASILIDLVSEANARGCSLPTINFSSSEDTNSNEFGDSIDFKIDAGATLLDVVRKLEALADFDVSVSPDYELNAYIEHGGVDTEIRLILGRNVQTLDTELIGSEKANSVLVESSAGFATVTRSATRRIETYLNATRNGSTVASTLSNLLLDRSEEVQKKLKVSIEPAINRPFIDFQLGDFLYLYGESVAYRIRQIAIGDGEYPNQVKCELGLNIRSQDWLQRVELALRNNDSGVSRANSLNLTSKAPSTNGGGGVGAHTHIEADITDLSYDAHSIRGRAIQSGTPSDGMGLKYVSAATEWQYTALVTALTGLSDTAISSPTSADILRYNGTAWENSTLSGAGIAASSHTHTGQSVIAVAGVLTVSTGTLRVYNQTGRTLSITKVHASVGVSPSGASIILDVKYDGSTGVTGGVTIAAGANTGSQTLGSPYSWADNHYLTLSITQVGSSVAGSDLGVVVSYS